jgi:solute carrier family 25 (mitochondrial carnitine/acylcarnitine transporter), member 20/29
MNNEKKINVYKSIVCSWVSGATHIIIGHPFDTLKTLKQGTKSINIKNNLKLNILFRGLTYPVLQNASLNSFTFGINTYFKNTENSIYVSNFYTSIISSLLLTPFDKFKIMKQYSKPFDLNIKNIGSSFKSFPIVALREIPATFIYFTSYYHLKEMNIPIFMCGAFSGFASWLFTYQIDTIKTRIQNESCKTIKEAYMKGHLNSGIGFCLLRSLIVNGVNFSVYEKLMNI